MNLSGVAMQKRRAGSIFDTPGYQEYAKCIHAMEAEVGKRWDDLKVQFPCLEFYDRPSDFFAACDAGTQKPLQLAFVTVAAEYSRSNSRISAKLLLLIGRGHLQFFLRSRQYFRELHDPIDKWNCLVEIFLRTLRTHAGGGTYDCQKIQKFIRASIQREQRTHDKTSMAKMKCFDEQKLDPALAADPPWSDGFLENRRYAQFLRDTLRADKWDIIENRCLNGEACKQYAVLRAMTPENAKKKLTRAKSKARHLLLEKFGDLLSCGYLDCRSMGNGG